MRLVSARQSAASMLNIVTNVLYIALFIFSSLVRCIEVDDRYMFWDTLYIDPCLLALQYCG